MSMLAKAPRPQPRFRLRLATKWEEIKDNKISYVFLAPYGIFFILFTVFPVLIAIGLSFTHYRHAAESKMGWLAELPSSISSRRCISDSGKKHIYLRSNYRPFELFALSVLPG